MKKKVHIGCSSFNNGYWKGIFYPENLPRSKWFEYYCEHFDTYELNATFYKFPTLKSLQGWYRKTPEHFLFSVKAYKTITHFKKFVDCTEMLDEFYTVVKEGLGGKLACVLFQLPPGFQYSEEKLELIISSMNPGFTNVIEFRNESWWTQKVFDALAKNGISFCRVSYPKLPETAVQTASTGYVRLHGVPKLFYSGYSGEDLEALHDEVVADDKWKEVFIYFNNTAGREGILNAVEMKSKENVKE